VKAYFIEKQMTSMLLKRVGKMSLVISKFQTALDADVNPSVNMSTSQAYFAHGLQIDKAREEEDRSPKRDDASGRRNGKLKLWRAGPSMTQGMPLMKNLSTGMRASYERELYSIADQNVTRTADQVRFKYGHCPPFDTRGETILKYLMTVICLPVCENIQCTLSKVVSSSLVIDLYNNLLWRVISQLFLAPRLRNTLNETRESIKRGEVRLNMECIDRDIDSLKTELSNFCVDLLSLFQKVPRRKKDQSQFYLPFIVARAILVCLRYFCPGSRHLYTPYLEQEVYSLCCDNLLGFKMSETSIQMTHRKLFPENITVNAETSESEPGTNMNLEVKEEEVIPRMKQRREKYDSRGIGSLLQEYFSKNTQITSTRPGTCPAVVLTKTLPSRYSLIGGTNTFRSKHTSADKISALVTKYSEDRDRQFSSIRKSRLKIVEVAEGISRMGEHVLADGVSRVATFSMDLNNRKLEKQKRKQDDTISGESKSIRNKHLQGYQKLDWHANLAVNMNLPPADQIIAATKNIATCVKIESHKQRTKARIMLCNA